MNNEMIMELKPLLLRIYQLIERLYHTDQGMNKSMWEEELRVLLEEQNTDTLILVKTIVFIGRHERGYVYTNVKNNDGTVFEQVIKIKITESPAQLVQKYSRYLIYDKKENIIRLLVMRWIQPSFIEGMHILELT